MVRVPIIDRRREVPLRRIISRQCKCSRRLVYLLDEHYNHLTDVQMNMFLKSNKPPNFKWSQDIHDCDDLAREFWCRSKVYFAAKGLNASIGFISRAGTSILKPHALNFFIRSSDLRLIFIDQYERVPLLTRAVFVLM